MDWQDRLFDLRQRGRALVRRFDARPRRERMALLLTTAALTVLAGDRLWLTPSFREFQAASQLLTVARQDQKSLADESERRQVQGDTERRSLEAEVAQWRQRTAVGARSLADAQAGLIGPGQMVGLLQQMLPNQRGVRVVSLKTLAPQDSRTPAAAASAPVPAVEGGALYRHGVEITVEGAYGDLMGYLSSLENLPGPRLLWGGVRLKVEHHPTVQLSLTVYTLSLDRAWLEL